MNEQPRTPGGGGRRDGDPDPMLEQRLRSWLHAEPDQPPAQLPDAAIARARATGQRPAWIARLRGGSANPERGTFRLVAATGSLVGIVLVAGIVWQASLRPQEPGATSQPSSLPPTSAASVAPSAAPTAVPTTGPTAAPTASPEPFDGRATTVLSLDRRAMALGAGDGSLWLGDDAGQLIRIDPASGTVIATIDVGGIPCGPILDVAASIWLTTCGDGRGTTGAGTLRIDPQTNLVANRYGGGGGDGVGIAAMNGVVWFVSDVEAGTLTAVDAVTGAHVRDLSLGMAVRNMTAGFGSLWVSQVGRPAVLRIDPGTGATLAEVPLSGEVGYLLTTGDAIWVAEPHQWVVGRIDPASDRLSMEAGAAPGVSSLAIASSGMVWSLADGEAMAIDPAGSGTVDRFPVPAHLAFGGVATHVLAIVGDVIWFADGLSLLRIDAP